MEPNVGQKYFGMRTERWPAYRIGSSESPPDYLGRIRSELASLEGAARIQWTGRRIWSSHTYPGGCWICEVFGLVHALLGLLEESFPSERLDSFLGSSAEGEDIKTG